MPLHVWHPFTQMRGFLDDDPPRIVAGEGTWLIADDGRRYLDGVASLWANIHGHRHPRIDAAVRAQLDKIAHSTLLGLRAEAAEALAERLVAIAPPGLSHVVFASDGASAVEAALKIAVQFHRNAGRTSKRRFLALAGAYHGDTLGAVSVGDIPLFHAPFRGLVEPATFLPVPHRAGADVDAALAEAGRVLDERAAETAALIVEPLLQAAAGMIPHRPEYLRGLADLCRRHDVLLIADEIATGFGRTGAMFASGAAGVAPDLLCLGKGLTGGYLPLAATLATDRVYEAFLGAWHEDRHFYHGHTYAGNALACAAASANLDVFDDERTLDALPAKIDHLWRRLRADAAGLPGVAEVRGLGLAAGIVLDGLPRARRTGHRVALAARRRGVFIRPLGDVVVLFPPLAVSAGEIDLLVDAVRDAILEEVKNTS